MVTADPAPEAPPAAPRTRSLSRIRAIDLVRGAVMVLMALDHVRVYSGVPAGGATPGVFLTRWVTHFCAPAFAFLAGTSAFLHGRRLGDRRALSRWLATRGALLVLLELTLVRLAWTFNFAFGEYLLAGVLWMLGWCMILLAGLVHLPLAATATLGFAVVALHPLVGLVPPATIERLLSGPLAPFARIAYFGGGIRLGGEGPPNLIVLYSIVPWIGVMSAGYAFGAILRLPEAPRRAWCVMLGSLAVAAFLVLRGLELYGDRPWRPAEGTAAAAPGWILFLNTTKYPASPLFLLMTLGPVLLAWPWLEAARGRLVAALGVLGRVPFFFYLLHIPLVHAVAIAISSVRTPEHTAWLFLNHPMRVPPPPAGYAWNLGLVYLVTIVVTLVLYVPCRRVARLKEEGRHPWLTYV